MQRENQRTGAIFLTTSQRKNLDKQLGCSCYLLKRLVLLKIDIFTCSKEIRLSTFLSPIIQHNHSHLSPEEDIQLLRYVTYIYNVPFS